MPADTSQQRIDELLQLWPSRIPDAEMRNRLVARAFMNYPDWRAMIVDASSTDAWIDLNVARFLPVPPASDGAHPMVLLLQAQRDLDGGDDRWTPFIEAIARRVGARAAASAQRKRELAYLERLLQRGSADPDEKYALVDADLIVPLGGTAPKLTPADAHDSTERRRGPVRTRGLSPALRLRPEAREEMAHGVRQEPPDPFDDAAAAMEAQRWAVVLGDPGAGKSTALVALASRLAARALDDETAPIPVLVNLADWWQPDVAIEEAIRAHIDAFGDELAPDLDALLDSGRAALLLDSLNEIPTTQWDSKHTALRDFLAEYRAAHPKAIGIVTSRDDDYKYDLGLRKIDIEPLDPIRIRQFCRAYLEPDAAEALFWQIVGEEAQRYEAGFREEFQAKAADWERVFWLKDTPPNDARWWRWDDWLKLRAEPDALLQLARNPFMLRRLIEIFEADQQRPLPQSRGRLFKQFVDTLIEREQKQARFGSAAEPGALQDGLSALAFELQRAASADGKRAAGTVIDLERAKAVLSDAQLAQARACTLLKVGDTVRFSHQLLQEYFAARRMQAEIEAGRLKAEEIWPRERWWQPTGWEVATRMLAELHTDGPEAVMAWLADAQPDLASECVTQDTVQLPEDSVLLAMRAKWQPRLLDIKGEPKPESRAGVGRALGRIRLRSGALLDERRGIGVKDGVPDIEWVRVPAGKFVYGGDEGTWFSGNRLQEWLYRWRNRRRTMQLPAFEIARYPVTYAQFEAFVRAEDGFANARWWEGLSASEQDHSAPGEQYFRFWNHPRDSVSWYDAVAFCRWLSAKLGYEVRLPDEREWERAARHTDGREYPWGTEYVSGHANIDESNFEDSKHYLQSTSAVGIYPQSAAKVTDTGEIDDLSGNVCEWCLNAYDQPGNTKLSGSARRVLRGGSWFNDHNIARASIRVRFNPDSRSSNWGFRVCRPC